MTTSGRLGWVAAFSFWALFGIISGTQVWISMITHGHSIPRLMGFYVAVSEGWFGATMLIVWLARRWPVIPPRRLNILIHALAACAIAVLHSLYWALLLITIRPYDRMNAEASELDLPSMIFYRLPLQWTLYVMVLGAAHAFDFYDRYRDRERLLAESRLHALELQLQPHFLFNTMNAISSLVRVGRNEEAITMIAGLSELLRYTLDHAGEQRVPLEKELSILQRYLEIQQARFPDRMTFAIDLEPQARRAAVPMLLLQPLAENAVRHGIAQSAGPGAVEIRAFREESRLRIDIRNGGLLVPGSPFGIGLKNTIARLTQLYGAEYRFDLANAEGGVLVSLSIPWSEVA